MAENPAPTEVVSGATETPESSSADPQTGAEPQTVEQEQPPKERPDYRKLQKEDADLNAHIQSEIARARTRWQRQQLKARAQTAAESEDSNAALEVSRAIAAEPDESDDGEVVDSHWAEAADRAQPHLEFLLRLDGNGMATNPYYVQLHQREGKAAMDKRYAEDPIGFVNWVDEEISELRAEGKAKKAAPAMAAAMAQDAAHTRLRGQPVPLGGSNSASGALTLEAYEGMTFSERQKLRKENPRAIDDMINRAAR